MNDNVRSLIEIQSRSYAHAGPGIRDSYPPHLAMDGPGLAAFLGRIRYAVLATGRRDGRPHAAPIAFSFFREAFWIATVEGARLRNLRTRPYASLVVMEGDERARHRAVIAEGPVIIHERARIVEADAVFGDAWRARHGSAPSWAAAMLELRPERIFSFDGTLE